MRAVLYAVLALFAPGCVAQRYAAPYPPYARSVEPPADLTHVAVTLDAFDITNQSATDVREGDKREQMRRAFLQHLKSYASFGVFITDRARAEPPESLEDIRLRVYFSVEETENRTIVFDGLFFYPFIGFFPFTPQWGDAIVTGTIEMERGGEKQLPVTVKVTAPYSMIFYSWYRVGPLEDAYARAHRVLFDQLLERLVARIGVRQREAPVLMASEPPVAPPIAVELIVAETIAATATVTTAAVETSSASSASGFMLASAVVEPPPVKVIDSATRAAYLRASLAKLQASLQTSLPSDVILPPDEAGVIFRPVHRDRDPGFWSNYLSSLGGVEVSVTGGRANVQSRATTSKGELQTVGTGQATSSGYRVSLFKPPSVTGFFYPPTIGFLSETISIRGFRDDVPLFTPPNSTTIPAVVSDPTTGLPIDAGEPISYRLKLKSGHIGQSLGLNLVIGTDDVQLFSTVLAGINVFEVRHSDVTFAVDRVKGMSVAAFQSGSFGAQLGIAIPDLHFALRAAAHIEWYAAFSYPERVEFQARSAFNAEKQVFERERVFVTGASLTTFDWQLSAVALF